MRFLIFSLLFLFLACVQKDSTPNSVVEEQLPVAPIATSNSYAIAIHGGAGFLRKGQYGLEKEQSAADALDQALSIGDSLAKAGVDAIDIVQEVIVFLENSDHFNAGKGAVMTFEKEHELDASIMRGSDLQAGAVGGVQNVKNPIKAARAVMDSSDHVLLTGKGADAFAKAQGLDLVSNSYFTTERALGAWERRHQSEIEKDAKHGTVGCVVRDMNGHLAAGTSTGGMTYKKYNRLGDSPIIGAGTYADDRSCAVSATGHGEYFIRNAVAHDISSLIRYKNWTGPQAAHHVIHNVLSTDAGAGGVICIDKNGNIALPFNTTSMFRGYVTPESREVFIYGNEE